MNNSSSIVKHLSSWLAGVFLLLSFHAVALSQQEYESEVPSREREALKKTKQSAAAARQLSDGEEVTYEQVLADPDNVDLNTRYAQSQIRRGNLRGAAATLERMLLIDPARVQVRLLYGVVLFRLDNLSESESAFLAAREAKLPPSLRDEVDEYLRRIKLRRKRTRFSGSFTVGYEYDTNRNAAARSGQRWIADVPAENTGNNARREDTSVIGIQSIHMTRDLGMQAGHQLFAGFDHFIQEQTAVDNLDLQSVSGEAGAILRMGAATFTPSFIADHIRLSRETFLRTQGANLLLERPLAPDLHFFMGWRWVSEDYSGITENASAPERSGNQENWTAGFHYLFNPKLRTTLTAFYNNKDAKAPYFDYHGPGAQTSWTWLLGKGQFLTASYSYGVNGYEDADLAVSVRTRRDEQHRTRLTYGAPVTLLPGSRQLPQWLTKNLTFSLTFEQFVSDSNIINYDYSNSKVNGMLTKSFEF